MSILLHGDCLDEMKGLDDNSVDLIFCDLPYGQTSCKWDCKIDLEKFWIEVMRIKKINTPLFFTTTTKFGVELINSAPKKCPFRYDIVWVKSSPAGFLCVSTDSSISVKDKGDIKIKDVKINDYVKSKNGFIKVLDYFDNGKKECFKIITNNNLELILTKDHKIETKTGLKPLEEINIYNQELILTDNGFDYIKKIEYVGMTDTCDIEVEHTEHTYYCNNISISNCAKKMPMRKHEMIYVFYEKLPLYDLSSHKHKFIKHKEGQIKPSTESDNSPYGGEASRKKQLKLCVGGQVGSYDPPLPVSVVKEEIKYDVESDSETYGNIKRNDFKDRKNSESRYDPPLPVSVIKEDIIEPNKDCELIYGENANWGKNNYTSKERASSVYDPPLPTTMLEVKSTRGKHSTEKPVALMEWVLKYYSKEGDTILDPTMGSGSTGVACKNMKRNFIGIEMDSKIYEVAVNRIEN